MKKLPIGVSNFEDMMKGNYYYVDKTLLIKDIIDLSGEVKLITRPRRFGKTLNMDMLFRFFSMDERQDLFEGLKIWEERSLVKDHYHSYPVLLISFREVKDVDWASASRHLKVILSNFAKDYLDLKVDESSKKILKRLAEREASMEEYADVFRFLTELLYRVKGKKSVILIDEYDVPIESAYAYRHRVPDYYDNMTAFMRGLLTAALKDNPYLAFGILTGVYRVAKESIFSGLNNLAVYTVFDSEMPDRFGFTEEEVNEMLKHYGLGKEDKKVVDEWYGGYGIGNVENLYNPWSVLNYIRSRVEGENPPSRSAQTYWINTSSNDLIIEQIKNSRNVKMEIDRLLEGKEVQLTVDPWLSLRDLERRKDGVWVLFANGGYLTARWIRSSKYAFKIPNEEVLSFFKTTVIEWIEERTNAEIFRMLDELDRMLNEGEYEEFAKRLESFIESGLSYYDVAKSESERFYKGFLLGILAIAVNGYKVESELESGYGRLDVVIYPKDKSFGRYAAIFEVKRSDDEGRLEKLAKEAFDQIKEKKYYVKMKEKGYKVIGFGIAFCGKRVRMIAALVGQGK